MCVLVQNADVDVNPIERVKFGFQLVIARQQLLPKAGKHIGQLALKVGNVHQLAFLLGQLVLLQFTIDALG